MTRKQSLFKSAARGLAVVFLLCLWCTNSQAYQVLLTSIGDEIKWDTTSETFYIDTSGGPSGALSGNSGGNADMDKRRHLFFSIHICRRNFKFVWKSR